MTERIHILERIENGEIDVEQGLLLLQELPETEALSGSMEELIVEASQEAGKISQTDEPNKLAGEPATGASQQSVETQGNLPPETWKWKRWWTVPLWLGLGVAALGGLFMYQAYWIWGVGFWMLCGTILLIAGLALVLLAWLSRNAPWFHLRIERKAGDRPRRIAFSFPLPVRPVLWFLRTFGSAMPDLEQAEINEFLLALRESAKHENPIVIQTNPGQGGELVEIFIG